MRARLQLIAIGQVTSPWGTAGGVRVQPLTDFPERLASTGKVYLVPPGELGVKPEALADRSKRADLSQGPVALLACTWSGKTAVVQLEGYTSRTAAEALRGFYLAIPEAELIPLPEDSYYVFQLIGCRVLTGAGVSVGEVKDVITTAANDVLVVARPGDPGQPDCLIPVIRQVISRVNLEDREITIEPLPGLLE